MPGGTHDRSVEGSVERDLFDPTLGEKKRAEDGAPACLSTENRCRRDDETFTSRGKRVKTPTWQREEARGRGPCESENAGRAFAAFADHGLAGFEQLAVRQVDSAGDAETGRGSSAAAQLSAQLLCAISAAKPVNERGRAGAGPERRLLHTRDERRGAGIDRGALFLFHSLPRLEAGTDRGLSAHAGGAGGGRISAAEHAGRPDRGAGTGGGDLSPQRG